MTLVHEETSYQVLGALFKVFNEVGYGHKEKVYQKSLAAVFDERKILYQEQVKQDLIVADKIVGEYYLDFLIDGKVILEIKAKNGFRASDFRQIKSYLETTGLQLGILATFTPSGVRHQRVVNLF